MHEKSIALFFETMEDHRHHNKLHKLIDVIIIAICGVVAGADTYEQIENFGKKRKRWLSKFLELTHGTPSHDTFGRIFERMNPTEFQGCFKKWIASVAKQTKGQVVAIDGKTLRRSHDKSDNKKAIHIDAMGTQKKIAQTIIGQKNDYVLALKENHKTIYADTIRFFNDMDSMKKEGYIFDEYATVDGGHGRVETRNYVVTSDIDWLDDKEKWSGLKSLGMVESIREINGESSQEKRYYISSLDG